MRTWLWCAESILCSCETFEVAATRGATSGRAFIVASAFTEPALRGKGHAVAMLNALVERTPDALAMVLFSEVGPSLYERAGFFGQPGVDLVGLRFTTTFRGGQPLHPISRCVDVTCSCCNRSDRGCRRGAPAEWATLVE
ncbi:MAG: hypothetical protein Q8S33_38045 [Myxococcales bacterium]|nr:hypothetical protein [Myxococcales bacterium]